jgi:uncharacterized membrane protein
MDIAGKARESFISGLILALPVLITLLIIDIVSGWAFSIVNPIVRSTNLAQYTGNIEIIAQLIAVLMAVIFLTVIGYLSNYRLSNQIRSTSAQVVKEVPLFGTVYTTVKQISSTFTGDNDQFKKTVLVEFPKDGLYSLGLVTSEAPKDVEEAAADGEEMQSVFLPLSPNPTMGNLIMVEKDKYQELDMSVQQGMKLLLTSGIAYKEENLPQEIRDATK